MLATSTCDLENYLRYPDSSLDDRIRELRAELGEHALILGHHYQRDEIIRFADFSGDSLRLSQQCVQHPQADFIVFCGVHFMAESADILRAPHQQVILPDLNAGCSMADMAEIGQVEDAWEQLEELGLADQFLPITYMNSTAAIKAFCGERGGLVCTSSSAASAFRWALRQKPRVFFLPDQHLGRNTGAALGMKLDAMRVWDPRKPLGGNTPDELRQTSILLWRGHCSVHQRFLPEHAVRRRQEDPGVKVLVHPECSYEVVEQADLVGSTDYIIHQVEKASPGTHWAIGTELHLVHRLAENHPEQSIVPLDNNACPICTTMFRISPQHLAWVLDNLCQSQVVNRISVKEPIRHWARVALDRMMLLAAA